MKNREPWTIVLHHNATGETVEYVDEYGDADGNTHIWEEGNYSCDCNRSLFFHRAKGVSEDEVQSRMSECGDKKYTVLSITRPNGEMIYRDGGRQT